MLDAETFYPLPADRLPVACASDVTFVPPDAESPRRQTERVALIVAGLEANHGPFSHRPEKAAEYRALAESELLRAELRRGLFLKGRPGGLCRYVYINAESVIGIVGSSLIYDRAVDAFDVICAAIAANPDILFNRQLTSDDVVIDDPECLAVAEALLAKSEVKPDGSMFIYNRAIRCSAPSMSPPFENAISDETMSALPPCEPDDEDGANVFDVIALQPKKKKRVRTGGPKPSGSLMAALKRAKRLSRVAWRMDRYRLTRFTDPAAVRLVDKVYSIGANGVGRGQVYLWLTDCTSVVRRNRMQFAALHPDFTGLLLYIRNHDKNPGLLPSSVEWHQLSRAIDTGAQVNAILKTLAGCQGWVLGSLRGKLHATYERVANTDLRHDVSHVAMRVDDTALSFHRCIQELGPAWSPRHGDMPIVLSLVANMSRLRLPVDALRRSCASPGVGASPWKRVWRELSSPGLSFARTNNAVHDIKDFLVSYCTILAAYQGGTFAGRSPTGLYMLPLPREALVMAGNPNLTTLLRMSTIWHQEEAGLRAAFETPVLTDNEEAAEALDLSCWPALFADVVAPNGVSFRCLTTKDELREHGLAMSHCVGGYSSRCLVAACHIVEVSTNGIPSSTIELSLGSEAHITQHRAHRNGEPSAEDGAAASWLARQLSAVSQDPDIDSPVKLGDVGAILERGARARELVAAGRGERPLLASQTDRMAAVLNAFRECMPEGMRKAWGRAHTPEERVEAVGAWLQKQAEKVAAARPVANQTPPDEPLLLAA